LLIDQELAFEIARLEGYDPDQVFWVDMNVNFKSLQGDKSQKRDLQGARLPQALPKNRLFVVVTDMVEFFFKLLQFMSTLKSTIARLVLTRPSVCQTAPSTPQKSTFCRRDRYG
jgi:hypothetical protein